MKLGAHLFEGESNSEEQQQVKSKSAPCAAKPRSAWFRFYITQRGLRPRPRPGGPRLDVQIKGLSHAALPRCAPIPSAI